MHAIATCDADAHSKFTKAGGKAGSNPTENVSREAREDGKRKKKAQPDEGQSKSAPGESRTRDLHIPHGEFS